MRSTRAILTAGVATGLLALSASARAQIPPNSRHTYVPARHGMASTIATDEPDTVPHTLADALGLAYESNPQLTGERAHLRSTDENVPAALAGWRPTIAITAPTSLGLNVGKEEYRSANCVAALAGSALTA